ncbi:hypothetical protein PVNG_02471 [Plasmodium vivax North Korean]|uniref:Uncharacterized protein n=1 Tax=Plasmodium vivax North Korean TaxID=1035514 RepID=A0A0J9W6V4_PLAVI|nr:hypothetical protein PVNG_02471 [Plasmodium vivax North Korean]
MKVQVYKSGEIIPQILSVSAAEEVFPEFKQIMRCPSCLSYLEYRDEGEKIQYCMNESCEKKIIGQIVHFCSRAALNIVGISERTIEKLHRMKLLLTISDIYSIHKHKKEIYSCRELEIKEKMFSNLTSAIEESKKTEPSRILVGLGIDHVGEEISRLLLKNFGSIEKIFKSSVEEKLNIPGIGPKCVHAIDC